MKNFYLGIAILLLLLITAPFALAQGTTPESEDVILGALKQELDRSMDKLKLDEFEPPYFISYLLKEDRVFGVYGRFGAILNRSDSTQRKLYVEVRVGDYQFDNSGKGGFEFDFSPHNSMPDLYAYIQAPIDDDPVALRNQLWLLTDAKFKQALAAFQTKKGSQVYAVVEEDAPPDFSREEAYDFKAQKLDYTVDREFWDDLVREETAFLRDTPHLLGSTVQVNFDEERKYLLNSEGTAVFNDELYFSLVAYAETRAPDGMLLTDAYTYYSRSPKAIPDRGTIHQGIARMTENLLALRQAEVIDPYTGPAILDPSVAGVFFHEAIGHRLEGERQKNPEEGQTFAGKTGQKILPDFISIIDDPTQAMWGDVFLNGHYRYDDEGVPARRVVLVENGILKNYLLSRSPIKGFSHSNGHGRNGSFEDPMGRMGNLILKSDKEISQESLLKKLRQEVRRQNKPYGLLIKKASGGETQTGSHNFQAFRNQPTLIYKVDTKTGKQTLVRGAEIVGTPLVSINKILATGDDYQVFNGFCGAESGFIPVSSVAPSLLVSEIELQKVGDRSAKPPILEPPLPRRE